MGNVILELLPTIADAEDDILIMNFGAWYNDFDELTADLPRFKESLQQHRSRLPKRLFWRESTAQHFDTPTGKPFFLSRPSFCVHCPLKLHELNVSYLCHYLDCQAVVICPFW